MQHTNAHTTVQNYLPRYNSFLLFILLTLISLTAIAKPFAAGGQSPDLHIQRVAERLDLNEQQREKFQTIMSASKTTSAPRADAMKANRKALQQLINSNSPDQAKIQSLAEAQGDLFTKNRGPL